MDGIATFGKAQAAAWLPSEREHCAQPAGRGHEALGLRLA